MEDNKGDREKMGGRKIDPERDIKLYRISLEYKLSQSLRPTNGKQIVSN